jgi:hypothetical protein
MFFALLINFIWFGGLIVAGSLCLFDMVRRELRENRESVMHYVPGCRLAGDLQHRTRLLLQVGRHHKKRVWVLDTLECKNHPSDDRIGPRQLFSLAAAIFLQGCSATVAQAKLYLRG